MSSFISLHNYTKKKSLAVLKSTATESIVNEHKFGLDLFLKCSRRPQHLLIFTQLYADITTTTVYISHIKKH